MIRIIKIIILFTATFMFALFGKHDIETSVKKENEIASKYDRSLFLTDTTSKFVEYMYSNPIDAARKNEANSSDIYTTKDIDEFCSKYYDIWQNELNTVYEKLSDQLTGEAKEKLVKSQNAWQEENQYDSKLWLDIFDLSKGHGSGDYSMITEQSIDRIRKRTFLLAEYYYWLTGDFEFSYKSD
ncbi:MAG: DUF1311 domain-containing protein [Clostridium sp.]|nr:DUF1311 domain-containing protein [Clostridium sp.]MCM1547581.1 DUF1311 domain-containing protein [Ruminococcus sp.]